MAVSPQSIRNRIREELKTRLPANIEMNALGDDDPLITGGLLDSVNALSLVDSLEDAYGIEFESDDLAIEQIDTIALLAQLVQIKLGTAGAGG